MLKRGEDEEEDEKQTNEKRMIAEKAESQRLPPPSPKTKTN